MKQKVSVPFMLLGILFNVCLIAANLLETKVIQVFGITVTAGVLVFPISYIINAVSYTHLLRVHTRQMHSINCPTVHGGYHLHWEVR